MYRRFGKRLLDVIFAALLLVALSPLLLFLALLVRVFMGSPVLFAQERPGLSEKVFRLHKFRSMTDRRNASGELLPDKERLTGLGRFLRKTSLDELPELWNVLVGEMSFVGPRPLLPEYLPYYTERERLRHSVRPGITGLAQVSGRNLLPWDERLELDAQYAESVSLGGDFRILFRTVTVLFAHSEGVAEDTAAAEGNLAKIRAQKRAGHTE